MSLINDLPAEVLARVFEIGIHQFGIYSLPPLRLTCLLWNDIVLSTPRLFGIIDLRRISKSLARRQLVQAKAAPLSVTIPSGFTKSGEQDLVNVLMTTIDNWVYASVPMHVMHRIHPTRRDSLRRLESLHVHGASSAAQLSSSSYWKSHTPKLRFFSAHGLCMKSCRSLIVHGITDFELHDIVGGMTTRTFTSYGPMNWTKEVPIRETHIPFMQLVHLLTLIPDAHRISLSNIPLTALTSVITHLSFDRLTELEISGITTAAHLLVNVRAPALRSLSIVNSPCTQHVLAFGSWQVVFMQWSQPGYLPVHLQSLDVRGSLAEADIPVFIQWLEKLPNVVRLMHEECTAITTALLERPELCSEMMYFAVEGEFARFGDMVEIARRRGTNGTGKLKFMSALICLAASDEEVAELGALVDELFCTCFSCALKEMP